MSSGVASEAADERYDAEGKRFSVCTLVTDWAQYDAMLATFQAVGFRPPDTEFLHLDNSANNRFDGFTGLNLFLNTARGRHIILCHQDVRLIEDGAVALEKRIAEVERLDPAWGVIGNAGGIAPGNLAIRITDPHGSDTRRGSLPAKVTALDENFLVVRRDANLAASRDLEGFHLYGTDLCLIADVLGYGAYVVDFHLQHLSAGNADYGFHAVRRRLIAKYRRALRSRWAVSPSAGIYLSACSAAAAVMNSGLGRKLAKRRAAR